VIFFEMVIRRLLLVSVGAELVLVVFLVVVFDVELVVLVVFLDLASCTKL